MATKASSRKGFNGFEAERAQREPFLAAPSRLKGSLRIEAAVRVSTDAGRRLAQQKLASKKPDSGRTLTVASFSIDARSVPCFGGSRQEVFEDRHSNEAVSDFCFSNLVQTNLKP